MLTVTKRGDLSGVAKELQRSVTAGQRDAARAIERDAPRILLDDVRRSRGSLRMMGGRLGVESSSRPGATSSVVELEAEPKGAWAIVTHGTRAYVIRAQRRRVLVTRGGDVLGVTARRRARKGTDYWGRATARLPRELDAIVTEAVDAQMTKGR